MLPAELPGGEPGWQIECYGLLAKVVKVQDHRYDLEDEREPS
jgi:hypothetical protein